MSNNSSVDASKMALSAEEKPLMASMATSVCASLAKADAEKPLAQRDAAERKELLSQAMQSALKTNADAFTKLYGADIFLDNDRMMVIGQKVGMLVMGNCPRVAAAAFQQ